MTMEQVAGRLGVSAPTVRAPLVAHAVPIRGRFERSPEDPNSLRVTACATALSADYACFESLVDGASSTAPVGAAQLASRVSASCEADPGSAV